MSIGALLIELAAPQLPGAACREHVALFDLAIGETNGYPPPSVQRARHLARAVCATCPALDACGVWLRSTVPQRRPRPGVVAGDVIDSSGHLSIDRARQRARRHAQ